MTAIIYIWQCALIILLWISHKINLLQPVSAQIVVIFSVKTGQPVSCIWLLPVHFPCTSSTCLFIWRLCVFTSSQFTVKYWWIYDESFHCLYIEILHQLCMDVNLTLVTNFTVVDEAERSSNQTMRMKDSMQLLNCMSISKYVKITIHTIRA